MKKIISIILIFSFIGLPVFGSTYVTDEEILESFIGGTLYQLDQLEESWNRVNEKVLELGEVNQDLRRLLDESRFLIDELQRRLASAEKGVHDALDNWLHMETLLDEVRSELSIANSQVNQWERAYIQLQRRSSMQPIVFGFGSGLMVAGGYFVGDGLSRGDHQIAMAGGGIILGTAAIYLLGRYLLKIW